MANVGPGFDILGFAMDQPGDEILISTCTADHHMLADNSGFGLPMDPVKNVATVAIDVMLDQLGSEQKFSLTFLKKIAPGSGIGSSAASAAGAVYGANELLGRPFTDLELVPFAMMGEKTASGSAHADNVAPALLGGFVLVRSYQPLDIIRIPGPEQIFCSVVYPEISIATEDSRKACEVVTFAADAIHNGDETAHQTAADVCAIVNRGGLAPAGLVEASSVVYKLGDGSLPNEFRLEQNHPNPFNPSTDVQFYLPEATRARLEVFNVSGQLVTVLADRVFAAGWHSLTWNARSAASGVYLYRLTAGDKVETKKMILLK